MQLLETGVGSAVRPNQHHVSDRRGLVSATTEIGSASRSSTFCYWKADNRQHRFRTTLRPTRLAWRYHPNGVPNDSPLGLSDGTADTPAPDPRPTSLASPGNPLVCAIDIG